MSKFIKVAQGAAPNTNGQPAQSGVAPSVLPTPGQNTSTPTAKPPVVPQMTNYLAQANITQPYTGTAEQNEKLRRVIDPNARTFYDAYVKKFGKWAHHPSERINNLTGGVAPKANTPGVAQQGAAGQQAQQGAAGQAQGQNAPAYPPLPEGFQRSQSGIVIPPLPR